MNIKLPIDLGRIPIVTRTTVVASTVLSLMFWILNYRSTGPPGTSADYTNYLALVPGSAYYLPWTLLTSSFVSSNIFSLGVSLASLLLGGRYIERSFSSHELVRFYLVVTLGPNAVLLLSLLLLWLTTRDPTWLHVSIHGTVGIQAGILVAFKQLVPEHTVTLYRNLVKIRVRHFPLLFLISTACSAAILGNHSSIALSTLGFLASWIYLRFYKTSPPDLGSAAAAAAAAHPHPHAALRGDASETFALSQFFPDVMQGPIDRLATVVFDQLVAAGICLPLGQDLLDATNEFGHRPAGSGVGRAEAERRRTSALRALDMKMSRTAEETTQPGNVSLPPQVNH